MPKLNTTIDNLELKTNKVIDSLPSTTWTDTQYPSAKTLYNTYSKLLNLMHPVGSILVTSTDKNPAETLGGEWILVDKALKANYISLTQSDWTPTNATIGEFSNLTLNNNTMSLRLVLTSTAELTDNPTTLGKLAIDAYGITELPYAIFYNVAISDEGNCTLNYRIDQDGTISVHEVLNINGTHTMPIGSTFYIYLTLPVKYTIMKNAFCDKFYWKRTV